MYLNKKFTGIFLCLLIIGSVGGFFALRQKDQLPWYEKMMMYHVLVKSFSDSDGDGKGDFKGLTNKLDYIQKLGVNAIYLLPITPALNVAEMPRSHFGYENTDFKSIHPDYGTLADFEKFVKEAHKRDIRVILDYITTVVSVEHPFFQDVLKNPNSIYKDWFITSPTPLEGDWKNFNDYQEKFTSKAWNPLPLGGYYYSLWGASPFLNYHNPKVQEYMLSVIDFWLDLGVDGFRVDATKHLFINGPGTSLQYHQPQNFEFWKKLRKHITKKHGTDKTLIAEVIPIPNDIRYVEPNRETFDLMFDSTFINDVYPYAPTDLNLLYGARYLHSLFDNEAVFKITSINERLTYHSDHDGARLATRLIEPTPENLKLAASILLLTPAPIKLYAGDEIGLKSYTDFNDQRTKWLHSTVASMAWDDSKNGGFTTSDTSVIPISIDYPLINVKNQEKDRNSILNYYRSLVAFKNKYSEFFFKGKRYSLFQDDDKIYAYFLSYKDQAALVVINLGSVPKTFAMDLKTFEAQKPKTIFGKIKPEFKNQVLKLQNIPAYSTSVVLFDQIDLGAFLDVVPQTMVLNEIKALGKELASQKDTLFIPNSQGVLKIKQGQGKVAFTGYDLNLTKVFKEIVDTDHADVLLPITFSHTQPFSFKKDGVLFSVEPQLASKMIDEKVKPVATFEGNDNLRTLSVAKDDNFYYFKIDIPKYAMHDNGGLDFALLFNKVSQSDHQNVALRRGLSFWRLPEIQSKLPISNMILYERHINTLRVQTGINEMRSMGVNVPALSFWFFADNALYFMVSRKALPDPSYNVAAVVWSAGGNWGDKPPVGKPKPIVERLPVGTQDPSFVSDFVLVE